MSEIITIDTTPYATTKWYNADVELENGEEVSASIEVNEDNNIDSEIINITITSELPPNVDEYTIKSLIENKFYGKI